MEEKEYSVSEAVRLIGVESHVLRYWEEELQIAIGRTSQGHRIYSQKNIETFRQVKSLKEKGIQLKAIRVLLEETDKPAEDSFLTQIYEIERRNDEKADARRNVRSQIEEVERRLCEAEAAKTETTEKAGKETVQAEIDQKSDQADASYEIVVPEVKSDNLQQFEAILKQMISEVVETQNEKLKLAIADLIRDEIEELYLQYYQAPMQEAAAAAEKKHGKWQALLKHFPFGTRN